MAGNILWACMVPVVAVGCMSNPGREPPGLQADTAPLAAQSTIRNGDQSTPVADPAALSREVQDVVAARREGFKRLAKALPDREVLAIELIRTRDDEIAAVLTLVENGEPVRYVVMGDATGNALSLEHQRRAAKASKTFAARSGGLFAAALTIPPSAFDGLPLDPSTIAISTPPPHGPVRPGVVPVGEGATGLPPTTGAIDPSMFSITQPPPHGPVTPGIIAVGENLLGQAFDAAALVDTR